MVHVKGHPRDEILTLGFRGQIAGVLARRSFLDSGLGVHGAFAPQSCPSVGVDDII